MIPAGVQVYVASMPVDFRKGATGLMALVRDGGADPFSGALYVFRSKRADRIYCSDFGTFKIAICNLFFLNHSPRWHLFRWPGAKNQEGVRQHG
jgi:transposase